MPPIHAMRLQCGGDKRRVARAILRRVERIPAVRRTEGQRHRRRVDAQRILEGPRAAGVVLEPGAALCRVFLVVVDVELDLALAPPEPLQRGQPDVGPDIVAAANDPVEDHMVLTQGRGGVAAAPVRVEQCSVVGQVVVHRVIELVVDPADRAGVFVGQLDPGMPPERHGEVAVQPAGRRDHDRLRGDERPLAESVAEEVAERYLDGRPLLVVPPHPQDEVAQYPGPRGRLVRHGHPDVLDHARTVDIGQRRRLARVEGDSRAALAGGAEGRGGRGGLSGGAGRVLGVDRAAPAPAGRSGQCCPVSHVALPTSA